MKKILVVGSKGMVGHLVYHYLKELAQYEVADIARDDTFFPSAYKIDVADLLSLKSAINDFKPEVIINCIGILNTDAENNPDKAILLNSFLPHFLANSAQNISAKLIHISTDCVFSGRRGKYTELDDKDGSGFYAESKSLGEVTYPPHLTIRTSIVGPELKPNGIGLLNWFLKQNGDVKGYTKALWTGVTTLELAKGIHQMIGKDVTGLYQFVNNKAITKFDLLNLFRDVFVTNVDDIIPFDNYIVDKSLVNTRTDLGYTVPDYIQMLTELKDWMIWHRSLYPQYADNWS